MKNDVVLAIFLGIISYSMLNIGMGLQKKGAASLPKINKQKIGQNIKNFLTCKPWVMGFILVTAQWALLSFALDIASVSIITPLMSVGMVALIIFSYFYLKEPISKIEITGIIIIIIGIVLLGITTPRIEIEHTYEYVIDRLSSIGVIIFLVVFFLFTIFLITLSISRNYKNADILFSIAAGITDALGAILLRAFMGGADFRDGEIMRAAAKLWSWWVLMIIMSAVNFTATIYLQVAYQRGRAVIVAPIFAVLAMIVPVFGGIIIFEEWNYYFTEDKFGLMAGKIIALVIVSIGAIVLSIYSSRKRRFHLCEDEESLECELDKRKILEIKEKSKEDSVDLPMN
ncbi:MAG: EamA family transporter [Asgard group archaeon]|nr:EamA family transporter [Asgard group archaeon]